jgi:hypothetical protein
MFPQRLSLESKRQLDKEEGNKMENVNNFGSSSWFSAREDSKGIMRAI